MSDHPVRRARSRLGVSRRNRPLSFLPLFKLRPRCAYPLLSFAFVIVRSMAINDWYTVWQLPRHPLVRNLSRRHIIKSHVSQLLGRNQLMGDFFPLFVHHIRGLFEAPEPTGGYTWSDISR